MKKIYMDLRTVSAVPSPYLCGTNEIMSYSGANIGNFAFRQALNSLVDISEYEVLDYSGLSGQIDQGEKIGHLVVSCANWLCRSEEYERSNGVRASLIEKANCPVTVFGLGAQAPSGEALLQLGENTKRLISVISERSMQISVRDEFTFSLLNKLGVNNAVITGCPSNFINMDTRLGKRIIDRSSSIIDRGADWEDLKVHFTEFSGGHKDSQMVLKGTLDALMRGASFYVAQSPVLFPLILGESGDIPEPYLGNIPLAFKTTREYKRFLRSKCLHFTSIDAWMDFARTCDFSVGMRIHGNMLPLQAGIPSLVIGHDSRTSGLSSTMGIPVISPENFIRSIGSSPIELLELVANEMSGYDIRRQQLAKVFYDYIVNSNIEPTPSLKNFIVYK